MDGGRTYKATTARLDKLSSIVGQSFYLYDFGAGWEHRIDVLYGFSMPLMGLRSPALDTPRTLSGGKNLSRSHCASVSQNRLSAIVGLHLKTGNDERVHAARRFIAPEPK